jgi:hypothetical protein
MTPGRIDELVRVSMMQEKSHARMRARILRMNCPLAAGVGVS